MLSQIRLFIFDLDGVITDTAEYHYLAWKSLAQDIGISIDREFNEQLKGVSRMASLERILSLSNATSFSQKEKETLCERKNDHYRQLIQQITPKDILPGIESFLKEIKKEGIPIALGSASRNAFEIIERLELNNYFDYIVNASEVKNGKPHPETFTKAADYFDIPYKYCVGVEDAEAGIEALKAANMLSIGLGSEHILHKADKVVSNTAQLNFKELNSFFHSHIFN
ncbi:beta-phosphoglucomutase [Amphibacillus sp. Q70]|uniref:beta-phosphoglucomutase n=1 Tax=Amphibacillus sp. Q70 TaxID=3453416 RepID=UPI003F8534B6